MKSSIWFDAKSLGWFLLHIKGHMLEFPDQDELHSLRIVFILANSADPDEMLHVAAFHLCFHCLPKYRLGVLSIQRVNF